MYSTLRCDMNSRREWCNHSNRLHPLPSAHDIPSMSDDSPRWIRRQEDISSSNSCRVDLCSTTALSWTRDSWATITSTNIRRIPLTHTVDGISSIESSAAVLHLYQDDPIHSCLVSLASKRQYGSDKLSWNPPFPPIQLRIPPPNTMPAQSLALEWRPLLSETRFDNCFAWKTKRRWFANGRQGKLTWVLNLNWGCKSLLTYDAFRHLCFSWAMGALFQTGVAVDGRWLWK